MSREATELASDVRNAIEIHQGEDHRVEDRQHFRHWSKTDAAPVLSQRYIAPPVEPIFYGPVGANQMQQTLGRTALRRKTGPAVDHFHTPLLLDAPFPLQTKHLSHLAPVATQVVIEIRTGHHLAPFQATMPFLDLDVRPPGPPIRLLIFKEEFQVRLCGWCIAFDDHDHIPSRPLYQATELVIALGGIGGENAPFAQDFRQQGLERTPFIVALSNWALLQDDAGLRFIDMQQLLLGLLSSIGLRSCSS